MNSLRHIRKDVFRLKQSDFAALIGVAQSSISRWENGDSPSLDEMASIRRAAADRGLPFEDRWFFEAPISERAA